MRIQAEAASALTLSHGWHVSHPNNGWKHELSRIEVNAAVGERLGREVTGVSGPPKFSYGNQ